MIDTDHDMLIRHDEQLRALSNSLKSLAESVVVLGDSVSKLRTELRIARAFTFGISGTIAIVCSIIATTGTWYVMVHFATK